MTDHPSALVSVPRADLVRIEKKLRHGGWPTDAKAVRSMLAAAPAAPQAAGVGEDDGAWIIVFEDRDREQEVFTGFGARDAAQRRYDQVTVSWNAHLFERVRSALPLRAPSREPEGGAVRQVIIGFDVEEYVDGYEFRGDEGSYTPTENERALITDAIHGVLSELSLATREEAPADHHERNLTMTNDELIEQALSHPPMEAPAEAGEAARIIARHLPLADAPDTVCLPITMTAGDLRTVYAALRAQPQAREDAQPVAWKATIAPETDPDWPEAREMDSKVFCVTRPDGQRHSVIAVDADDAVMTIRELHPYTHPAPDALRVASLWWNAEDWEQTFYSLEDAYDAATGGEMRGVAKLGRATEHDPVWALRIDLDTTGDGETDDYEIRLFKSVGEAHAYLAALQAEQKGGA